MDKMMKERGLNCNKEKMVCIVMGTKQEKKEATENMMKSPLMCGGFEMKEKQIDKWFGQTISS